MSGIVNAVQMMCEQPACAKITPCDMTSREPGDLCAFCFQAWTNSDTTSCHHMPVKPGRAQTSRHAGASLAQMCSMCCRGSRGGKKTFWGSCTLDSSRRDSTVTSSARYSCSCNCDHLGNSLHRVCLSNIQHMKQVVRQLQSLSSFLLLGRKLCDCQASMCAAMQQKLAGQHLHQGDMS